MSSRLRGPWTTLLIPPALFMIASSLATAGSRDVDTHRFPRLVRILLQPEEETVLKGLKDDKDRLRFQEIFWARRDPTPGTPRNEFEDNVRAVWSRADELFSYPNQKGSESGCGQVLALLGRPEEVLGPGDTPRRPTVKVVGRTTQEGGPTGERDPGPGRQFDNMAYLREGSTREPETWVYRDRPGLPYSFTGAELRIAFDNECRYAEGAGILGEDLRRAAAAFVTRPDIGYELGADGHLLALAAASPGAGGGVRALLAAPRTDFPLEAETKLLMRAPKGEAYVAGLVHAALGAAGTPGAPVALLLAVQANDASGQPAASTSRDVTAAAGPDGTLDASWGISLKPGRYKLLVAALLPAPGRGAVSSIDVEVPAFDAGAFVASPLVLYPDERAAAAGGPRDPFGALQLGAMRLRPRMGNVFTPADSLMVVSALYGAKLDPATGQAAVRARYSILKAGRPVARGAEDSFTTADAVASVGPIPLSGYEPGSYVVRLDTTDQTAGRSLRQEAAFEIRAAAAAR